MYSSSGSATMRNVGVWRRLFVSGAIGAAIASASCSDTPTEQRARREPAPEIAASVAPYDPIDARAPGYVRYQSPLPGAQGGFPLEAMGVTFTEPTYVYGRATGTIAKNRSSDTYVWGTHAGEATFPLDPNGYAWSGSYQCVGNLSMTFLRPNGTNTYGAWCTRNGTNLIDATPRSPMDTSFVLEGTGSIERLNSMDKVHQLCGSPGQNPCYNYAGRQTVELVPGRQFLTLSATSGYEGDSITFTASAGTYSISVRQWIWLPDDTTIAPATVACAGTASVCKTRVYSSGRMFVRARVNTPTWRVEQASTAPDLTPVTVTLSADPTDVASGDTVTYTATTNAAGRPFSASSWNFSPSIAMTMARAPSPMVSRARASAAREFAGGRTLQGSSALLTAGSCQPGVTQCAELCGVDGTMTVVAVVNGLTRSASVLVQPSKCQSGDALLDNTLVRKIADSLFKASRPTLADSSTFRERAGWFIRDSSGSITFVENETSDRSGCSISTSPFPLSILGTGAKVVGYLHTHPFSPGQRYSAPVCGVASEPSGTYGVAERGFGMFSAADWRAFSNFLALGSPYVDPNAVSIVVGRDYLALAKHPVVVDSSQTAEGWRLKPRWVASDTTTSKYFERRGEKCLTVHGFPR